jgi:hypothetical protein
MAEDAEIMTKIMTKLLSHRGYKGWRIRPYPYNQALWLAETYTFIGKGNTKGWRALWDEKDKYRTFATPDDAYKALLAIQKELDDLEKSFQ